MAQRIAIKSLEAPEYAQVGELFKFSITIKNITTEWVHTLVNGIIDYPDAQTQQVFHVPEQDYWSLASGQEVTQDIYIPMSFVYMVIYAWSWYWDEAQYAWVWDDNKYRVVYPAGVPSPVPRAGCRSYP